MLNYKELKPGDVVEVLNDTILGCRKGTRYTIKSVGKNHIKVFNPNSKEYWITFGGPRHDLRKINNEKR